MVPGRWRLRPRRCSHQRCPTGRRVPVLSGCRSQRSQQRNGSSPSLKVGWIRPPGNGSTARSIRQLKNGSSPSPEGWVDPATGKWVEPAATTEEWVDPALAAERNALPGSCSGCASRPSGWIQPRLPLPKRRRAKAGWTRPRVNGSSRLLLQGWVDPPRQWVEPAGCSRGMGRQLGNGSNRPPKVGSIRPPGNGSRPRRPTSGSSRLQLKSW